VGARVIATRESAGEQHGGVASGRRSCAHTRRGSARIVVTTWSLLAVVAAGCGGGSGGSGQVTVPQQDATPPSVTMDVFVRQNTSFSVTSSGVNPTPPPAELRDNDEVSLVAKCSDTDGGCSNIEILWSGVRTLPDGSTQPVGGATPLADNKDTSTGPGGSARTERFANGKLDIRQLRAGGVALRIEVTARAHNFHQGKDETRKVILFWSPQAPLARSTCPRFNPIGSDPPEVLDSREISLAVLNGKNRNPAQQHFVIGYAFGPNKQSAMRIEVSDPGFLVGNTTPVGPSQLHFALQDKAGQSWTATTVDSRNCATAGRRLTGQANNFDGPWTTDNTDTTTLVFSAGGQDFAILDEAPFWEAFGGRTVTFTRIR
jgi:hypothetical protein